MAINMVAAFAAIPLLRYFGRRSMLILTFFVLTVCMVLISFFNDAWIGLTLAVVFVIMFELGPGPICWLYMSEVMNEKGVSVGTFLNWTFTMIIGILTPFFFTNVG